MSIEMTSFTGKLNLVGFTADLRHEARSPPCGFPLQWSVRIHDLWRLEKIYLVQETLQQLIRQQLSNPHGWPDN